MIEGNFKFRLILVKFRNMQCKEKFLKSSRDGSEVVKFPLALDMSAFRYSKVLQPRVMLFLPQTWSQPFF